MADLSPKYWPFEVRLGDPRTDLNCRLVAYLESTARLGYRPRKFTEMDFLAEAADGRWADLIYRGRQRHGDTETRWEVALGDRNDRTQAFWADDFPFAAAAALIWLRGGTAAEVLAAVEGHVIRGKVVIDPPTVSESAAS